MIISSTLTLDLMTTIGAGSTTLVVLSLQEEMESGTQPRVSRRLPTCAGGPRSAPCAPASSGPAGSRASSRALICILRTP
eukprot:CAMPEP_0119429700 /NCGR_PEP_ID=MMETSP1335-20130426/42718_1 /TAXON_ID=259385 /ORGANISM="Chrysoculter rhomboideus, Strain RCC1486" /LENGTH=79 /DNA_ID=CAMNT_0007455431 /DNA_START=24 /DNA_END=260 /DNA_ORIENTATION=+